MNNLTLEDEVKIFVEAWITHLFTPANRTALDYVEARTRLVQMIRPDFPIITKQNASKVFQHQRWLAELGIDWSLEEMSLP